MVICDNHLWCYYCKKITTRWRLRWWVAFFGNKVFLIKVHTLFFGNRLQCNARITFICSGKPKNVYNPLLFRVFSLLHNHHYHLVPEPFHPPYGSPVPTSRHSPCTLPQPLASINWLPVSMDLPILDASFKWTHTICGLLGLALLLVF